MVPEAIVPSRSCWISSSKTASSTSNGPRCSTNRAGQRRCSVPSYLCARTSTGSIALLPPTLGPISQELRLSLFSQRVVEKLIYHFKRHGCDVGTQTCGFDHVNRMAQARREHFRLPRVVLINLDDALQQFRSEERRVGKECRSGLSQNH